MRIIADMQNRRRKSQLQFYQKTLKQLENNIFVFASRADDRVIVDDKVVGSVTWIRRAAPTIVFATGKSLPGRKYPLL